MILFWKKYFNDSLWKNNYVYSLWIYYYSNYVDWHGYLYPWKGPKNPLGEYWIEPTVLSLVRNKLFFQNLFIILSILLTGRKETKGWVRGWGNRNLTGWWSTGKWKIWEFIVYWLCFVLFGIVWYSVI